MQEHSNLIQKDNSYEESENTVEVVSWYYNRGQSNTSYTKKEVFNIYLDQNVETLHKLDKIPRYVLTLNADMHEREVSYFRFNTSFCPKKYNHFRKKPRDS